MLSDNLIFLSVFSPIFSTVTVKYTVSSVVNLPSLPCASLFPVLIVFVTRIFPSSLTIGTSGDSPVSLAPPADAVALLVNLLSPSSFLRSVSFTLYCAFTVTLLPSPFVDRDEITAFPSDTVYFPVSSLMISASARFSSTTTLVNSTSPIFSTSIVNGIRSPAS